MRNARFGPYAQHFAAIGVAFTVWLLYAQLIGVGAHGWWQYPAWWHSLWPSYFQIAAFCLPLLLAYVLAPGLPAIPAFGVATAIAGMALFSENPHTDVVYLPDLPLRIFYILAGAALSVPCARLKYVSVLLVAGILSIPVALIAVFSREPEPIWLTLYFYAWHIVLPAQVSSLLFLYLRQRRARHEGGAA